MPAGRAKGRARARAGGWAWSSAGIAGAFTGWFARQALGSEAEIVVHERGADVGGRVAETHVGGLRVEARATLIHSANRYLADAATRLGLTTGQPARAGGPGHVPPRILVWDGGSPLLEPARGRRSALRTLVRYGRSLRRARRATRDAVERLARVYAEHDRGLAFAAPEAMLRHLGLYELTQVEGYTYFRAAGIGPRFAREFSDAVARANYHQDGTMNALATLVSLAGAGLDGGRLFTVAEGNRRVAEGLLARAGGQGAGERRRAGGGGVRGGRLGPGDRRRHGRPLPRRGDRRTPGAGRAGVRGAGAAPGGARPSPVLTPERPEVPFSALGWQGPAADGRRDVYKLFSRRSLEDGLLDRLFAERGETVRLSWHAYPVLRPAAAWPPFRPGPRLYYANAMESAVSTMEPEAIAAHNVVSLLRADLAT